MWHTVQIGTNKSNLYKMIKWEPNQQIGTRSSKFVKNYPIGTKSSNLYNMTELVQNHFFLQNHENCTKTIFQ